MSKFVLSAFLVVGLFAGPASAIAVALENPAKSADQENGRVWADRYWTWLQQSAGG